MDQPNSRDAMMRLPQIRAVQVTAMAMTLLTSQLCVNFAQQHADQLDAEKAPTISSISLSTTSKDLSENEVNASIKQEAVTITQGDYSFAELVDGDYRHDNGEENSRQLKNDTAGFTEAEQEQEEKTRYNDYSKDVESNFEGVLERQLEYERLHSNKHDFASKDHFESKKLLSRKRRYLVFPEGSSFQVVFDGVLAVVDYTNYLIIGITAAMAWELPSKSASELLADLELRLYDGTLGTVRNDSIDHIQYVDTKPKVVKPNYIDLGIEKNMILKNRYPSGQLSKYPLASPKYSHKRIYTPAFVPPMHGKYYFPTNNVVFAQRPYDSFYKNKPHYYGQTYYNYPKTMETSAGRRNDQFYRSRNQGKNRENPFYKYTKQIGKKYHHMLPITPNVKYPWWNLADRLSKLTPSHHQNGYQKRINSDHYKNNRGYMKKLPAARGRSMNFRQDNDKEAFISTSDPGAQHIGETKLRQHIEEASTLPPINGPRKKHRIIPVFGKRSAPGRKRRRAGTISDDLSKYEGMHIRYHRETRHTLYERVENFLEKRGSNGHHCVLRAICETGKKAIEKEPGTFIGELMRAVFTIPEAIHEDVVSRKLKYKEQRYDAAQELLGDCGRRYMHCKDSLWNSDYVSF